MISDSYPMSNIVAPGEHDVLCGRGGHTIHWSGNIKFRALVEAHRDRYQAASRVEKGKVVAEVVQVWRNQTPPGRFLTLSAPKLGDASPWHDIGDKSSQKKTAKRLREGQTTTMSSMVTAVAINDEFANDSSVSSHSISSSSSRKRTIRRVSDDSIDKAFKKLRFEMNECFDQVPAMRLLLENEVAHLNGDDFAIVPEWSTVKSNPGMKEAILGEDLNLDCLFDHSMTTFDYMENLFEPPLSLTSPASSATPSWNTTSSESPLLQEIAGSIPSAAALTEYSLFD